MSRSVMWSPVAGRVAPPGGNWPILPRPAALVCKTFADRRRERSRRRPLQPLGRKPSRDRRAFEPALFRPEYLDSDTASVDRAGPAGIERHVGDQPFQLGLR